MKNASILTGTAVPFHVFLAGDSTMQYNDCTTYPQTGWGQVVPLFFRQEIPFYNFAKNGRSTKSFIDEGRLADIAARLSAGDYLLIQFGHNDEKMEDPSRGTQPYGDYMENLARFAETASTHNAYPLFLTSISRRLYTASGTVPNTHGEYPDAMIRYAEQNGFPVIDMNSLTRTFLEKTGKDRSRSFFMNFDKGLYRLYNDGKADDTHLRYAGAFEVARIAATELEKIGSSFPLYRPLSDAVIPSD